MIKIPLSELALVICKYQHPCNDLRSCPFQHGGRPSQQWTCKIIEPSCAMQHAACREGVTSLLKDIVQDTQGQSLKYDLQSLCAFTSTAGMHSVTVAQIPKGGGQHEHAPVRDAGGSSSGLSARPSFCTQLPSTAINCSRGSRTCESRTLSVLPSYAIDESPA